MIRKYSSHLFGGKFYDIIISGGGMVGSVLACKLAKSEMFSKHRILLVEGSQCKKLEDVDKNACSNRVSVLNNASVSLLKSIDTWDYICGIRCHPVKKMKIWGNGSNNIAVTFDSEESCYPNLAYVVENELIVASAYEKLKTCYSVTILDESKITRYSLPEGEENVRVQLNDGEEYESNLLIGTDGINSDVRKAMNSQYLNWNYKQRAVVATLALNEVKENDTAWQKFLSTGPVALLPLSENASSLVWTTTPEQAKQLLEMSEESFVDALNTALWEEPQANSVVDNITSTVSATLKLLGASDSREYVQPPCVSTIVASSRASFPVGFGHAAYYAAPRTVLVGDSAHRIHPLAGQGVNLGFGDVECLVEMMTKHSTYGRPLGNWESLRDYETNRQRSNVPKLLGVDLIQKVAGHTCLPFMAVSNAAMQIANASPLVRKFLINAAAV